MGAGRPVSIVEVEARACPLRQLRRCFIATAQAACHAPASEAVTDVTDYFSSNPLFFGHRVIDVQSVKTSAAHDRLSKKLHSLPSSIRRIIQTRDRSCADPRPSRRRSGRG
jgi:hypothetical protein